MGQPELQPGRAIFLGRPGLFLGQGRREFRISTIPYLVAGDAGHFLHFHRLHQQSADHERGI